MKIIDIDKIQVDEKLFIRDNYNEDAIERYRELHESGTDLGALVVQANTLKLIDGFHRLKALRSNGVKRVKIDERNIPDTELLSEATKENSKHGVPLTKKERNGIIEKLYLNDNKTQQQIADVFGLNQSRVSQLLGILVTNKTNISVVTDWLNNPELTHKQIAEKYEKVGRPRVTQIINEFKQEIHNRYKKGQLKKELKEWVKRNYDISVKNKDLEDILIEFDDLNESIVKLPKIINKDFFKTIQKIDDKSIDLIYVDPPYSITKEEWDQFEDYEKFTKSWLSLLLPKLKDTGRIYISFSQERMFDFHGWMEEFIDKFDLVFSNVLVWNYKNNKKPHNKKQYKYTWEPVFFFRKKKSTKLNLDYPEWGENITDFDVIESAIPQTNFGKDKKYHPTQKPLELLRRIVLTGSNDGDTILDPFAGSGTTGVVCRESNRNFILIEKNPEYVKIMEERICGNGLKNGKE